MFIIVLLQGLVQEVSLTVFGITVGVLLTLIGIIYGIQIARIKQLENAREADRIEFHVYQLSQVEKLNLTQLATLKEINEINVQLGKITKKDT